MYQRHIAIWIVLDRYAYCALISRFARLDDHRHSQSVIILLGSDHMCRHPITDICRPVVAIPNSRDIGFQGHLVEFECLSFTALGFA